MNITESPAPGKFLEDAADLDRLVQFLNTTGRAKLQQCQLGDFFGFESLLRDRYYLAAVDTLLWQCSGFRDSYHQREGQTDHDRGLAEEKIRAVLERAPAEFNASVEAIDRMEFPANSLDLEVLGRVMKLVIWTDSAWQSVPEIVDDYLEKRERMMVEGVYLNIYIPHEVRPVIEWFIANYPWAPPVCQIDEAKLQQRLGDVWGLFNATLAKAQRLRPPDEEISLSTNYGRLTQDFRPSMEYADRRGWWPATLWYEAMIASSSAYWDHRYDPVLPSQEEAIFLVASYLNESRNLVRDDELSKLQGNLPFRDWQAEPEWAAFTLAYSPSTTPWTYGSLPCRGDGG